MALCVPIRDMKNTAEFASLVERERDVTVTRNGYSAFHCLSQEAYNIMQEEVQKAHLLSRILLAEEEIESGDYSDYAEFSESLKSAYGL